MKTVRIFSVGLGLFGLGLLRVAISAENPGNDLTWTADTVKAVLKKSGGEVTGECGFVNRSEVTVRILKIAPACGCTSATSEKLLYRPGEAGTIKLSFKAGTKVGMQREEVLVLTSGSETPKRLVMEVNIRRSLALSVDHMIWNRGQNGAKETILSSSDLPFEVVSANTSNDTFKISTKKMEGGKSWAISVQPRKSDEGADGIISLCGRFSDDRVENIGLIVVMNPER